jgi:hypothetical protein
MIKSFLIITILQILLFSSQQIILVVAEDYNSSKASLVCYEEGKKIFGTMEVNIGKNGLGMGIGAVELPDKNPSVIKKEGDQKAPAGIFKLTSIFSYDNNLAFHMPHLHASKKLICVDDSDSNLYNKIVQMPQEPPKSFEYMKRDDRQYELGVVIEHNKDGIKKRGSCIFMHIKKSDDSATAGCTAMSLQEMQQISSWLDESKNPLLIQIPKLLQEEIKRLYPELKNSELLH